MGLRGRLISCRREISYILLHNLSVKNWDVCYKCFQQWLFPFHFCMDFWIHFLYLNPVSLQWSHVTSFPLLLYAWLSTCPFPLSESFPSANSIYFFEWIFVTDPLNEYVFGFSEVLIKSIDLREIFGCHPKRDGEGSKKESCTSALIPEVGTHLMIQWEMF